MGYKHKEYKPLSHLFAKPKDQTSLNILFLKAETPYRNQSTNHHKGKQLQIPKHARKPSSHVNLILRMSMVTRSIMRKFCPVREWP